MVCVHGFTDTWRSWELVLAALEAEHDVLAPTLAGHAGGPAIEGEASEDELVDALERAMDEAGFETAHVVGNSLGAFLALKLAERGRARSVVALAPAGGWADGNAGFAGAREYFLQMLAMVKAAAPHADAIVATPEGRRQATAAFVTNYEHIPPELVAHVLVGAARCDAAMALLDYALEAGWDLDGEKITCPVRIVWGTGDLVLPYPAAAARFHEWVPAAEWVELEGIGHCPQLDVPAETAELVLGFSR